MTRVLLLALLFALLLPAASASADCTGGGGAEGRSAAEIPPAPDDWDCDFVKDAVDNCPPLGYDDLRTRNPNQANTDASLPGGDEFGDWCDADDDADAVDDWQDHKFEYESRRQKLDNCRTVPNLSQADANGNGVGDVCETDRDGDGHFDAEDNCEHAANPDQADLDGDRVGDACDNDVDGDYFLDAADNCPRHPNPDQTDLDRDGRGSPCDDHDTPPAPPAAATTVPPDRSAPSVTLTVKSTQRLDEIESGLVVRLRCSEACTAKAELTVDRSVARSLRLRRTTVVAGGTARVEGAASTYAFVRFDARVRGRLWRRARTRATLKVEVIDQAGNVRRVSKRLTLVA